MLCSRDSAGEREEGFKQGSGSDREDGPAEGLEEAPYMASGLSGGWRE